MIAQDLQALFDSIKADLAEIMRRLAEIEAKLDKNNEV